MKKYNALLLLRKKKKRLNDLILTKKLNSKVIINISKDIDYLQNILEQ